MFVYILQLLKAQTEAKQQGKVPPTKIAIQLPQSISNIALTTPANPVKATASVASPNMIVSTSTNINNVASVVPSMAKNLKRKLPKLNDEPQIENKSSKRAQMNLRKKPNKWNDSKNENLLSLTGNERLKEDIIDEAKDYLRKEYDEKFENMQSEIENLKKQNENENQKQNDKVSAQNASLKKDIILKEVKELYEKLEYLQQENEDLKKEHEKEIVLLKKENMELKEKLHAKTASEEINDNLNIVHETLVNPSEFKQEYILNTDITIKEEPIE